MTNKVIVALDNKNLNQIIAIVKKTKSEAFGFKIGKEFFYNYGIEGYKKILNSLLNIFLRSKITRYTKYSRKSTKSNNKTKTFINYNSYTGGDEMQKIIKKKKNKTKILGVTILTSLNDNQTKKYYNNKNINQLVKKFAKMQKIII